MGVSSPCCQGNKQKRHNSRQVAGGTGPQTPCPCTLPGSEAERVPLSPSPHPGAGQTFVGPETRVVSCPGLPSPGEFPGTRPFCAKTGPVPDQPGQLVSPGVRPVSVGRPSFKNEAIFYKFYRGTWQRGRTGFSLGPGRACAVGALQLHPPSLPDKYARPQPLQSPSFSGHRSQLGKNS